jgi:hypothetical protein
LGKTSTVTDAWNFLFSSLNNKLKFVLYREVAALNMKVGWVKNVGITVHLQGRENKRIIPVNLCQGCKYL